MKKGDVLAVVAISAIIYFSLTGLLLFGVSFIHAKVEADVIVNTRISGDYQYSLNGQICFVDLNNTDTSGSVQLTRPSPECLSLNQMGRIAVELNHVYDVTVISGTYNESVYWKAPSVAQYGADRVTTDHFVIDIVVFKASLF